jgi:Mg-chelatase subunit ChlD
MTDLSAGIDLAATQLRPVDPAAEGPQRVIVLLSDGRPTLPHRGEPVTNRSDSVAAAQRAAGSGVRIVVHGIGPDPAEQLLRQIAEAAKGEYTRVEDAAQIDLLAGMRPIAP